MKAGYHGYCITTFTGWMLQSGFSSEWLQQYISVCLHGMAPAYVTELCTPVTASASRLGGLRSVTTSNVTLQTVNIRHPCVQCRWSSLLECLTGLFKVDRSFVQCFEHHLKTFLFRRH